MKVIERPGSPSPPGRNKDQQLSNAKDRTLNWKHLYSANVELTSPPPVARRFRRWASSILISLIALNTIKLTTMVTTVDFVLDYQPIVQESESYINEANTGPHFHVLQFQADSELKI